MMNQPLLLTGLCILAGFSSCKPTETASTEAPEGETASALDSYLLSELPTNAIPVSQAFASSPGTEVTVTGEVMGRMSPFVKNRAMVVLGDPNTLTPCNHNPDDGCTTPWDVCCDDPDVIKTSIATIQIVDEDGKVMKKGLKGLGGIQELTTLTVVGEVAEGSNAGNLVINASGIHVGETDPFMTQN